MSQYHQIGQPIGDVRPSVYELVILDHVPYVDPNKYRVRDVEGIDPRKYFVTSGDAVQKAKVLEKNLWKLAGDLRKKVLNLIAKENDCTVSEAQDLYKSGTRPNRPKLLGNFEADIWKAAGKSRKLTNALEQAKGDDCFLETEWDDHRLLCIPKNPRR